MTEPDEVHFFDTVADLREWVRRRRPKDSAWLGFFRANVGQDGVTLAEAAAELAEVSWVEGERRVVDNDRYAVRFAPGVVRRAAPPTTTWQRGERGEMPVLNPAYERELRADPAAWEFFQAQQPSYRRVAIWWVMSGKKEETRQRRLTALVAACVAGERLPQLMRIR